CRIVAGEHAAEVVWRSDASIAFLDIRPVFPGHTLVVPPEHVVTLADLPAPDIGPFFTDVQRLAVAVQAAPEADGSFVAINNVVSQSVTHLHAHVAPPRDDRLLGRVARPALERPCHHDRAAGEDLRDIRRGWPGQVEAGLAQAVAQRPVALVGEELRHAGRDRRPDTFDRGELLLG